MLFYFNYLKKLIAIESNDKLKILLQMIHVTRAALMTLFKYTLLEMII